MGILRLHGTHIDGYDPKISAVIPAYNAEKFLGRCINSCLFQTDCCVEVIVVIDEGTTDKSEKIAEAYTKAFPGKVFCIVKDGRGLSPARKAGMEAAHSKYVLFVDVDDYIDQKMCETVYTLATEKNADIVSYGFAEYQTYKNRLVDYRTASSLKTQSVHEAIEDGGIGWWKFLFSVDFLKEKAVFYDMLWEDAGEIPALLSKAKNYAMTPSVLYYKINNEESMTETFPIISRRFVEHTLANKMTLENVEHKYYSSACLRTAKRMIFPFFKFYSYYDHLVEHMKEYSWIYSFKNDVWNKLTDFERKQVTEILAMPEPKIPLNIYINGFAKENLDMYRKEAEKGFWNWESIIILDESNCDIKENNYIYRKYKNNEMDIVAEYFAAQKIYLEGGIYIGRNLKINNTLNRMRFVDSFWGFETEFTITDQVFGAKKGDLVMGCILKTYQNNDLFQDTDTIAERIKMVLIGKCGIKMTGREQKGRFGANIFPAMVFVVNANGQCRNISYVNYENEGGLTISRKVFEHIIDYQMANAEYLKLELSKAQKELGTYKNKILPSAGSGSLSDINREYIQVIADREEEIRLLKASFTYRFGYVVTYIPRKIYRFLFRKKFK